MFRDRGKRKSWTRISFRHPQTTAEILAQDQALSQRVYRFAVTALFALGVCYLIAHGRATELGERWPALFAMVFLAHGTLLLLVRNYHREVLAGARSFLRLFILTGAFLIGSWWLFRNDVPPLLIPLPVLAMPLALIYSSMLAVHVSFGVALFIGLIYYPTVSHPDYLGTQVTVVVSLFLGSLVAIVGMNRIRTRTRVAMVGLASGAVQCVAIAIMQLWEKPFPPLVTSLMELRQLADYLREPAFGLLNGVFCGILITSALPFLEKFFEVITDQRLIELSDQNNPLLHQFALLAPGSWQHSLMVAQLSEEAALSIGANELLARVGALYHDIGKMQKPGYFAENIRGDDNPHDRLSPEMSRLIIISHVKDGIAILEEEGLPKPVVDMVPMHHGKTIVEFFYNKKRMQDLERNERTERQAFSYPGPRPTFAEAGILMLADSTEAISRTLKEPTPARLRALVRSIIRKRMMEGELNECELTLSDLSRIEDAFVRVLSGIYHQRISYRQEAEARSAERASSDRRRSDDREAAAPESLPPEIAVEEPRESFAARRRAGGA